VRKSIFILCFAAFLSLATVFPAFSAGPDPCAEARDAVLNARNTLRSYFTVTGKYPEKLSGTSFNPPNNVVIIYEKMITTPSKEFYMVRGYMDNCGSMYLAAPTTSEIFQIPLVRVDATQATGKDVVGKTPLPAAVSSIKAILVATATFFLVFFLVILIFYLRNIRISSPPGSEK
jgi:hypothetical protein